MARTNRAEVPLIERRELGLAETLDDREHPGVDETEVGIGMPLAQLAHASVILGQELFDDVGTCCDVVEEGDQDAGMKPDVDPVVHLHQHWSRNDDGLRCGLYEALAGAVVGVAAVQRRIQGSSIDDQRQERGSGRSSPERRAVSERPESPTPMLLGRGR